jgi:oligopeptide/dipeptide ABC transporter ATP-binding protein
MSANAESGGAREVSGQTTVDGGRSPVEATPLVVAEGLEKHFPVTRGVLSRVVGHVRAVDGVSFVIRRGETLGLVGESGSGKTTVGRLVLRLLEPTAGTVRFDGHDLAKLDAGALRALRRRAQIVFQDPYGSLNPRMTVGDAIGEALRVHGLAAGPSVQARVRELLGLVGLRSEHAQRYPHEFSGGQRQRIGIARALSVEPEFLVCDEPVSALDVSVQAQVVNLLVDLQRRLGLTYLFIAHDLGVIEHVSDRIAVMYLGRIVEIADAAMVRETPRHPYTRALLSAVPKVDPRARRDRIVLSGEVPSPTRPPTGCPFHPRCPHPLKDAECTRVVPPLAEKSPGHFAACIKEGANSPGGPSRDPDRPRGASP